MKKYALEDIPERLTEVQDYLQKIDPEKQAIPYSRDHWATKFGNDQDFEYLTRMYPEKIYRANVAELARGALQAGDFRSIRRVFLAAMMWGYGKVGYGPYRTRIMLDDEHAEDVLLQTFALITEGKIIQAYRTFQLNQCGPAFFTKYLYFVGLGCQIHPCPLILDSVVAHSLESLLERDISQFAKVVRDGYGEICSIHRYAEGYLAYVELLHSWADSLHCRPDTIEYFLFDAKIRMRISAKILLPMYQQNGEPTAFPVFDGEEVCV